MSLRKRPLIEGRSGSFVKILSINEALFAVILVGRVVICYDNAVNVETTESFLELCKTKMFPTSVLK